MSDRTLSKTEFFSQTDSAFAADVRAGLSKRGQKELYSKYLYDEIGSALFDAITLLPEYGLTRADERLLRRHAQYLAAMAGKPSVVAELGSGSSAKARWVLEPVSGRGSVTYCPIDISQQALDRCRCDLSASLPGLEIVPFKQSYIDGLREAIRLRQPGTSVLVLFLGSTIGNFEPLAAQRFLQEVRRELQPGDLLYVSADLEKPVRRMIAAYDDALGVTAAFNLNLLARINKELGGNFVLSKFRHEVRYDGIERRIEMHLRSLEDQRVGFEDFVVDFQGGETIWTESSYKFRLEDLRLLARQTGFWCGPQWVDEEWPFAQTVMNAV